MLSSVGVGNYRDVYIHIHIYIYIMRERERDTGFWI